MASEDAVLAYWKEQREQLRQSETQRSTLTNFLLVITAALSALVVQQQFSGLTVPLSSFIVIAGIYGSLAVAKYYERSAYHLSQARALTETLVELGSLGSEDKLDARREAHYEKFPTLRRIRLNKLWVVLHIVITLYGATLLLIALIRL